MIIETFENEILNTTTHFEDLFIKHYFKKEKENLSKEDKHEIDCFGAFGITEWVIDNVRNIDDIKIY